MATNSTTPPRNNTTTNQPKRGKIKAQIFENIGETIASVASKAVEALGFIKKQEQIGSASASASASSSPPPSAYNTDG